ncbi:ATP-binding protein [Planococcus salinarum]|uniref:ATP-binding protein n=1 Tax=Planococcus salinarum TaxID=622695 RepID=UPI000E3E9FA2|nr:ATP-binding protein [Planococcus salinarum]TAA73133.1 PAS domain S-box protein [Planococcus salinarum]
MKHSNANSQKNTLFLQIFGFSSLLHIALNTIFTFNAAVYAPVFGLFVYVTLWLLKRRFGVTALRFLLLYAMNIYMFILNIESLSAVTLVYFSLPLLTAALLSEFRPMAMLSIATLLEVLILVFFFGQLERMPSQQYNHLSIFTFLIIVLLFTFSHTFYFSRLWQQLQERNKSMEEALISREGYLQLFFETAKDAMAVFDKENRVITINPAFEKLYGWSAEDSFGTKIKPYPKEKEEVAELQALELLKGKSFTLLDTVDMKKDGTKFHAQITLSPILDRNQEVIATSVISRDISYQKESEQLLLQSEKLKLAGEIAAGVAHEIRNPMTVISGFMQIMQQDPEHPYPQYTQLIHSELERINLIISEFLVLAKPQAPVVRNFSLRKLIGNLTLLFSSEFNLKGIVFKEEWTGEEDYTLSGEEHSLKQVFINLFKNSAEAIHSQGTISLAISTADCKTVSIKISDSGIGMSPESLSRIFEPFYTTKENGTGLGLLISQKIIQDHGGSIKLSSKAGKGTTAEVLLPKI